MKLRAVIVVALLVLCAGSAFSQIPPYINYQGILTGPGGEAMPDGMYTIGFVLFNEAEFGDMLYEWVSEVQVTKGLFNAYIGPIDLPFDRTYWLGIKVGEEPMLFPRVPLVASPYCFTAKAVVDSAITATKIADGQVVRSLNGLADHVNLLAGSNVSITPSGNDLVIAATGGGGGVSGAGVAGQVSFWNGTSSISGDNGLYWDNTNKRLGIGTMGPNARLRVESNEQFTSVFASTYQSDTTEVIRANYLGGGNYDATAIKGISLASDGYGIGGSFTGGYKGVIAFGNGGDSHLSIIGIEATASGSTSNSSYRYGVVGYANGPTAGNNLGVVGNASGEASSVIGVYGVADGSNKNAFGTYGDVYGAGSGARYAVYGTALNASGLVYAGYFNGDLAYTGLLLNLSDAMFKSNMKSVEGALDKVLALEPKKYSYDHSRHDGVALPRGEHYGLIAQEVEEVLPELVGDLQHPARPALRGEEPEIGESFRYKGINYIELIPILVQAIKEQQETIEELKAEVELLKRR